MIVEIEYYLEYRAGEVTLEKAYEMAKLVEGAISISISFPGNWRELMAEEYETDKIFFSNFSLEVPYDLQEEIWYTEELLETLAFMGVLQLEEW